MSGWYHEPCIIGDGTHFLVWANRKMLKWRCLQCWKVFPAYIPRNAAGQRIWTHCKICKRRRTKKPSLNPYCHVCIMTRKQFVVPRLRRQWALQLAAAMNESGTLGAMEEACKQAIIQRYFYDDWGEYDGKDIRWAFRRLRNDIDKWLRDKKTSWNARWQFLRAMLKMGQLKIEYELRKEQDRVPTCRADLEKADRDGLVLWIRQLLSDGYISLDDIDPAPLVDRTEYAWLGKTE